MCALAKHRYGISSSTATVDADHAALFLLFTSVATVNGRPASDPFLPVRDCDIYDTFKHRYRQLCSAVYRTEDARYFQLHGGVDARPVQEVVGVPTDRVDLKDRETIVRFYAEGVGMCMSAQLDEQLAEKGLGGSICYTPEGEHSFYCADVLEYRKSEAYEAAKDAPVYELERIDGPPAPWPPPGDGVLSGIKVLEISRIVAAPVIGRGLADHGATVLRVAPPADMHSVHVDLNAGKYVATLDLDSEDGLARVTELAAEADVVIDGIGLDIQAAVRKRNPTVVWVRENCYGFHGPLASRTGWGLADSLTGISYEFGRRLGLREPVLSVFPGSEIGAGAAGVVGVLHALYRRAIDGGGYTVDVSEVYFNHLMQGLGAYDDTLWTALKPASQIRHYWDAAARSAAVIPEMVKRRPQLFKDDKMWCEMEAESFGGSVRIVKPVVQVEGLRVAVRRPPVQNGDDEAQWPQA